MKIDDLHESDFRSALEAAERRGWYTFQDIPAKRMCIFVHTFRTVVAVFDEETWEYEAGQLVTGKNGPSADLCTWQQLLHALDTPEKAIDYVVDEIESMP